MNDRFNFRVWFDGRFVYKSLCDSNVYTEDDKCICPANTLPDLLWEQCTGLKDKNGKFIFEGDICKVSGKYFNVDFDEEQDVLFTDVVSNLEQFFGEAMVRGVYSALDCETLSVEVIGNIHENKELLK